jgi:polyisoprenoid-binding protein YceI
MSAKTLLLVLLVMGGSYAQAQDLPVLLEPGSKIWLQGSAGPVGFSCTATTVDVRGSVHMARQGHDQVRLNVTIPVRRIDCGLEGINNDMRDALKYRQHPSVTYTLSGFKLVGQRGLGHWVETRGKLTVAGATRDVTIRVLGHPDSKNGMRITGQYEFDMTDYGIVPPSPMMGMIKVNKMMDIYFDVVFRADRNQISSN